MPIVSIFLLVFFQIFTYIIIVLLSFSILVVTDLFSLIFRLLGLVLPRKIVFSFISSVRFSFCSFLSRFIQIPSHQQQNLFFNGKLNGKLTKNVIFRPFFLVFSLKISFLNGFFSYFICYRFIFAIISSSELEYNRKSELSSFLPVVGGE